MPSLATRHVDLDLWMRKRKMDNGPEYYEYMLLYVDDCLCISQHPEAALDRLRKYFHLKPGSVGPPNIYLGGKLSQVILPNGVNTWAISTSHYIQEAVRNVEVHLKNRGMTLAKGTTSALSNEHGPDLDVSTGLNDEDASYYQSLI